MLENERTNDDERDYDYCLFWKSDNSEHDGADAEAQQQQQQAAAETTTTATTKDKNIRLSFCCNIISADGNNTIIIRSRCVSSPLRRGEYGSDNPL